MACYFFVLFVGDSLLRLKNSDKLVADDAFEILTLCEKVAALEFYKSFELI